MKAAHYTRPVLASDHKSWLQVYAFRLLSDESRKNRYRKSYLLASENQLTNLFCRILRRGRQYMTVDVHSCRKILMA